MGELRRHDLVLCTTLHAPPEVKSREMCHIARPDDVRRKLLFNAAKAGSRITGVHAAGNAAPDHFMDVVEEGGAAAGMTLDDIRARSHVIDHWALNPRPDQIERDCAAGEASKHEPRNGCRNR